MAQVYRINPHFSNLRTVPFTTTSLLKSPYSFLSYFSAAKSMRPRAMERWEVPRRSKSEDRMSEGWRLVSCARFGHEAASPDKGLGRNSSDRHLAANGMDSHYHFGNHSSNSKDNEGPIEDNNRAPPPLRLLTLPTILTLARVAAVPLLVATFYKDGWWATTATTTLFIAAAITDWLDGYIARKMRLGTAFGAFLDPVADKLMVAATLVLMCSRPLEGPVFGQVPWLLTVPSIAIIGREITMSAVREWAASQNGRVLEAVAVNNLGKWKTATQMTALIILLATRDSSLSRADILVSSGVVLLYISAGLAVWSLVVYMRKISRLLLK